MNSGNCTIHAEELGKVLLKNAWQFEDSVRIAGISIN
jgi:hypothetical protein